jgi:hypothetical protein
MTSYILRACTVLHCNAGYEQLYCKYLFIEWNFFLPTGNFTESKVLRPQDHLIHLWFQGLRSYYRTNPHKQATGSPWGKYQQHTYNRDTNYSTYLKNTCKDLSSRVGPLKTSKFSLYFLGSCIPRDVGTGGQPGRRGSRPRSPLPGGARGAKVPFNLKDCLGEIANWQKC